MARLPRKFTPKSTNRQKTTISRSLRTRAVSKMSVQNSAQRAMLCAVNKRYLMWCITTDLHTRPPSDAIFTNLENEILNSSLPLVIYNTSYDQNDARIVNQSTETAMHWAFLFVVTDPQFNHFALTLVVQCTTNARAKWLRTNKPTFYAWFRKFKAAYLRV